MLEAASWVVKTWWLIYTDFPFAFRCRENVRKHTEEAWMSVKPDRWIRRMALEHKMIEPFTDRQIRGPSPTARYAKGSSAMESRRMATTSALPTNFAFSLM